MREIKYRGKDIETGEWVYGSLFQALEQYPAIAKPKPTADGKVFYCLTVVNPDTVGQCTGLKDRNGKEIYEGDLLLSVGMVWEVVYDENLASFFMHRVWEREHTVGRDDKVFLLQNQRQHPRQSGIIGGGEMSALLHFVVVAAIVAVAVAIDITVIDRIHRRRDNGRRD